MTVAFIIAAAVASFEGASASFRGAHGPRLGGNSARQPVVAAVAETAEGKQFPDEQTRRAFLEAAFKQIDSDGDTALDRGELRKAGFDADLLLERLDANEDGQLTRDEFVDQLVSLTAKEETLSTWEIDDQRLDTDNRGIAKKPAWGSRTVRRAIAEPKFELVSLVAVLTASLSYAVGTLNDLSPFLSWWVVQVEDIVAVYFGVEFLMRWWGRSFSKRSLVEPTAIIDFISFAPLLLALALPSLMHGIESVSRFLDGSFPAMAPAFDLIDADAMNLEDAAFADNFSFLRLLRVLRLQRYVRDLRSFRRFESALGFNPLNIKPYQLEVARVVTSIFTLLFISTGLIYNAEHVSNPQLPDYFTALYFGLTTLTTVGFGDITPITTEGRLVVSVSILAGIAVIPVQLSSLAEALFQGEKKPTAAPAAETVQPTSAMQVAAAAAAAEGFLGGNPDIGVVLAAPCRVCGAANHPAAANFCYSCGADMPPILDLSDFTRPVSEAPPLTNTRNPVCDVDLS